MPTDHLRLGSTTTERAVVWSYQRHVCDWYGFRPTSRRRLLRTSHLGAYSEALHEAKECLAGMLTVG